MSSAATGALEALVESCRYCARLGNVRATARIALVVSVVLTGINEGDTLAAGHLPLALAIKLPLNFLVPFLVANLGALAARKDELSRRGPRS